MQVRRRVLYRAAFVDESLESKIKVKTTIAMWTVHQMLLYDSDFLGAEFPVKVEMEASNCFYTIHTIIH